MATIAAVTTAPLVLRNTDASLSEITTWFKTWIGWGVHRKQDWALSQLALLYLNVDTPPALQASYRKMVIRICSRHLQKLLDPDSTTAAPSAINTPAAVIRTVTGVATRASSRQLGDPPNALAPSGEDASGEDAPSTFVDAAEQQHDAVVGDDAVVEDTDQLLTLLNHAAYSDLFSYLDQDLQQLLPADVVDF